ncbi:cytochrome c biogenesis protein ResB [Heyndrickxia coagulans]|mgnify:FL=1|uniref:cytochrome c biogenesis protein ResB n=1 Tax=Heyndrickxia coagulans TaxID=1398 RepID=UPI001F43E311|nr:cytochrome c biogenesis protein ResB [Heyndrickxia coagulans]MEC5268777.1 cytochrome c biogenesis protein ResB [Heyndrickxia coagulans]MED4941487.1 cytochrome c biogenesis protein ResB [Heyndrickxia coagulans]UJZ86244.1 cytochrome c biogenesis protein ResB [Heyndrickxia coagulans]
MKDIKCECGHVNPPGTVLCESCGKALTAEAEAAVLHDMRYEGSARRSQVYKKTPVDKIWNFFSSVKTGVWLIVLTLIASALGTVLPQAGYIPSNADPSDYYEDQYGWFGKLWYTLGFDDLYNSWWYLLFIALIGVSLVICSLDRFLPLRRALSNQKAARHEGFLKRQRLYVKKEGAIDDASYAQVKRRLEEKHYKIREEGGNLFAEKNRFSRWGPYVNHIGLIIFLCGCMLRFIPGMYVDELVWVREGEKAVLPGTNGQYVLLNKQFKLQVYSKKDNQNFEPALNKAGNVAKNFETDAVLYKQGKKRVLGEDAPLKKVKSYRIQVNKPLKFGHYAVYQMDYKLDEFQAMSFAFEKKSDKKIYGKLKIDLYHPKAEYPLGNGYKVKLLGYYPSFTGFAKNGEPQTDSYIPNNPAFLFSLISPEHPKGEKSFVAIRQTVEPLGKNDYKLAFAGLETRNVSALAVRKDETLWVLAVGGAIFMIGVIQGAYWNHRRFWLKREKGAVLLAAHTNKNWYGLKRELEWVLSASGMPALVDRKERKNPQQAHTA